MDARMQKYRVIRWARRLLALAILAGTFASGPATAQQSCPAGFGIQSCTAPIISDWSYGNFKTLDEFIAFAYPPTDYFPDITNAPCSLDTALIAPFSSMPLDGPPIYAWIDGSYIPVYLRESSNISYRCPVSYGSGTVSVYRSVIRTRRVSCPSGLSLSNTYVYFCWANQTRILTLSGGTEIEPSSGTIKTLPFIASVNQNGQPITNPVSVHVSVKVDSTSGGHSHVDSNRPRGGVANVRNCPSDDECWSDQTKNGQVVFNFNAPEASGTHTITVTCDGCTNNPQTAEINVKVKEADAADWDHLPASPDYALVGGEPGKKHHDNHYLTAMAKEHLLFLIHKYNKAYPSGPVLYLNDASLEWGGKFDIQGKWDKDTAHKNHQRGVVIDVRANQDPTAIPQARFARFEKLAADSGAYANLHCAFSGPYVCPACLLDTGTNRHYHVRLLGQSIDR